MKANTQSGSCPRDSNPEPSFAPCVKRKSTRSQTAHRVHCHESRLNVPLLHAAPDGRGRLNLSSMDEVFVTVARFDWLTQAELAQCRLEACGIDAFLPDEFTASLCWHYGKAGSGYKSLPPMRRMPASC